MREVCFDTETTGLDPRDGHKVIEIGCVELINKVRTGNSYQTYINPQRDVPEGAFKVHGISAEFLKDKPKFSDIAQDFVNFISGTTLIAHNAAFDMKFINFELRQCGFEIIERGLVIDSLQIARNKFPGSPNSLDALCKRFGIDLSKRTKHGALLDAELLADIYLELSGGSQFSMFGDSNKDNEITQNTEIQDTKRTIIPARNFSLTPEEESGHQEFIKNNFKTNPWSF